MKIQFRLLYQSGFFGTTLKSLLREIDGQLSQDPTVELADRMGRAEEDGVDAEVSDRGVEEGFAEIVDGEEGDDELVAQRCIWLSG
jgi:hypothetical protein